MSCPVGAFGLLPLGERVLAMSSAHLSKAERKATVPPLLVLCGVAFLLIALATVAVRAALPSDGARLSGGAAAYLPRGLVVAPYPGQGTVLQDGDVVLQVAGRDMSAWAQDLLAAPLRSAPAGWRTGNRIPYSVLRQGAMEELRVELQRLPLGIILSEHWGLFLFVLVSQVLGIAVLRQRPDEPAARALFLWAMLGSSMYVSFFYIGIGDIVSGYGFWLARIVSYGLGLPYYAAVLHIALVFPKPSPTVRDSRWPVPVVYVSSFVLFAAVLAVLSSGATSLLQWLGLWLSAFYLVAVIFLVAAVGVIAFQYARSKPGKEREQIEWAILGGVASIVVGLAVGIGAPLVLGQSLLSINLYGLLLMAFPISLAIAIWRHRLFNIEVVLQRTLVYVPLTSILAGLFAATMSVSQKAFVALTGQESDAAIVLTTLVLTTAFAPIKQALTGVVDRTFKEAPDAFKRLKALEEQVHAVVGVVDVEELTARLLQDSIKTLAATGGAVFVIQGDHPRLMHISEDWHGPGVLRFALEHDGICLGWLVLGQRIKGGKYSATEREKLGPALAAVAHIIYLVEGDRLSRAEVTVAEPLAYLFQDLLSCELAELRVPALAASASAASG